MHLSDEVIIQPYMCTATALHWRVGLLVYYWFNKDFVCSGITFYNYMTK